MDIQDGKIQGSEEVGKKTAFTIKQSAHAIHVLSTSLYKHPHKAIVRELLCNAWDSHIEAGHTKPVDLHLPTNRNKFFSVRDYGIGLSPADLESLYTTYFDSTKQDDDETTGYFGLGSKSPFSYTKEFFVITRFFGVKHTYKAYIDPETQMPVLQKMRDEPTHDDNGLEVMFDIVNPNEDHWIFERDAEKFVAAATSVVPAFPRGSVRMTGTRRGITHLEEYQTSHKGDTWMLPGTSWRNNYGTTAKAWIGNVAYNLEGTAFEGTNYINLLGFKPFLKLDNKDVDITPSREELHYSTKTIDAVCRALDTFEEEYKEQLEERAQDYEDLWMARRCYPGLHQEARGLLPNQYTFKKTGDGVDKDGLYYIPEEQSDLFHTRYSTTKYERRVNVMSDNIMFDVRKKLVLVYKDSPAPVGRIKGELREKGVGGNWHYFQDKDSAIKAAELLGYPEDRIKGTASFGDPIVVERVKGSKEKVLLYTYHTKGLAGAAAWEETELDMDAGGIYVEMSRFKVKFTEDKFEPAFVMNEAKQHLKIESIYGVKTAALKEFEYHPKWKTLKRAVLDKLLELEELPLQEAHKCQYAKGWDVQRWTELVSKYADKIPGADKLQKLHEDKELFEKHRSAINLYNSLHYLVLDDHKSVVEHVYAPDIAEGFREELIAEYPMLSGVTSRTKDEDILDYINLVDRSKKG